MKPKYFLIPIAMIWLAGCAANAGQQNSAASNEATSPAPTRTTIPSETAVPSPIATSTLEQDTVTPSVTPIIIDYVASVIAKRTSVQATSEYEKTLPTLTPSITTTLKPITYKMGTPLPPLTRHEWVPDPVLLNFGMGCGDGHSLICPPALTLYSNGLLIRSDGYKGNQPTFTNLDRRETCKLLNTVDQLGFFEYDPTVFWSPVDHYPRTYFEVNTWKTNYAAHTALDYFISGSV